MVMITIVPETAQGVLQRPPLMLNGDDNNCASRLGVFEIDVYGIIELVKQLYTLHDQLQAPRFVWLKGFFPDLSRPFPSNAIVHDFTNQRGTILLKPNSDVPRPLFGQDAMFDGVFHEWLQEHRWNGAIQ